MSEDWRSEVLARNDNPVLLALLDDLAKAHGIHPCARGGSGEIGLGAEPEAYAAIYVGRHGMSIALDPMEAALLGAIGDLDLLRKNPTSHYVKVPNDRLLEPEAAVELPRFLLAAFERSWQGPRWQRGSGARRGVICPFHHEETALSGWCEKCDGIVPGVT